MIQRAPDQGLALVLGCFISLTSASILHSAVIVTRPAEPVQVFGAQSTINVPVDIDGDGSVDFNFNLRSTFELALEPLSNGRMIVTGDKIAPLASGVRIGPELALETIGWRGRSTISACAVFSDRGEFVCVGTFFGLDAFIGIQFPIEGRTHYGWIRFRHFEINPGGWIIEWAYESTPGVPIYAGLKPVPVSATEVARPGYLRLTWPAEIGRTYQVQTTPSLSATGWTNLNFALPATATNIMVDLPIHADAQFFRVIEVE